MLRRNGADDPPSFPLVLFAVAPVLLSLVVYYPITKNYFFGDDLLNLYRLVNWGPVRFLLQPYAGHILVVRNAIYALCYHLFGTDVEWYFRLVLLTHCINVLLVFLVIRLFTHSARLACLGAALWGMSPVNVGALGWYSVYGQVLVGTSVAWMLYDLGKLSAGGTLGRATRIRWFLLVLATSTFFGTGIGIALASPVVAFVLLPPSVNRTRAVRTLVSTAALIPLLYFALHRLFPTGGLPFVSWKLLDEWPYSTALLLRLEGNGIANLLLGVFGPQFPNPSVVALLLVGGFLTAVALTLVRGPVTVRRQILGCLLIGAAGYASVALGRALFVASGMDPQRIASTGRYHYSGPMTLAIILCIVLGRVETWQRAPLALRNALLGASLIVLSATHLLYGPAIDHHQRSRRLTELALTQIRRHIDAAPPGGDVYIPYPKERFLGVGPLLAKHPKAFPGWAGVFVVFFPDNTVDGKRVRFVVEDQDFYDTVAQGKRARDLFVMATDVPHG